MTSSGNQMFVDRALVSNIFFRGRETGVALWGATPNNKFEWRIGDVQRQRPDPDPQRQRQVPVQRAPDVAAQRQPGAQPARLGHRRAVFGERLRIDDRARSMRWRSTGRTRTTSARRPATIRSGTPTASTASTSSRASRPTACTRSANRTPETGAKFDSPGRLHPGRAAVQPPPLRSRRVRYGEFDPTDLTAQQQHQGDPRRVQLLLRAARPEVADRHRPRRRAGGPTGRRSRPAELRSQLQFIF